MTVESVLETFKTNVEKAKQVLVTAIELLKEEDWTETIAENQVDTRILRFLYFQVIAQCLNFSLKSLLGNQKSAIAKLLCIQSSN